MHSSVQSSTSGCRQPRPTTHRSSTVGASLAAAACVLALPLGRCCCGLVSPGDPRVVLAHLEVVHCEQKDDTRAIRLEGGPPAARLRAGHGFAAKHLPAAISNTPTLFSGVTELAWARTVAGRSAPRPSPNRNRRRQYHTKPKNSRLSVCESVLERTGRAAARRTDVSESE